MPLDLYKSKLMTSFQIYENINATTGRTAFCQVLNVHAVYSVMQIEIQWLSPQQLNVQLSGGCD